jgi:hypothetical protein
VQTPPEVRLTRRARRRAANKSGGTVEPERASIGRTCVMNYRKYHGDDDDDVTAMEWKE